MEDPMVGLYLRKAILQSLVQFKLVKQCVIYSIETLFEIEMSHSRLPSVVEFCDLLANLRGIFTIAYNIIF